MAPKKYNMVTRKIEDVYNRIANNPKSKTVKNIYGKIKRNDPCPCDSGKKYKKCCGGK